VISSTRGNMTSAGPRTASVSRALYVPKLHRRGECGSSFRHRDDEPTGYGYSAILGSVNRVSAKRGLVYPRCFVKTVSPPASWDKRPLPLLLRGSHLGSNKEIARIERWYRELRGPKKGIRGRLRSLTPRDFWSALFELMTSRIFVTRGWRNRYEPRLQGMTPDFLVRAGRDKFLAEVLTAFQDPEDERRESLAYRVASELNKILHPIAVLVEGVDAPQPMRSLRPLASRVRSWLDTLQPGRSHRITISAPEVPIAVRLMSFQMPRSSPQPIVQSVGGDAHQIMATERLQRAIEKKVSRYRNLALPLVLFVWEGDWIEVTPTSLDWALFGRLRVNIARAAGTKTVATSRVPGGVMSWGPSGQPTNASLSAVAYCSRVYHRGRVHTRIQVYHHPYARRAIPRSLFAGVPQYVPYSVSADGFSCRWDRKHRSRGIVLR